MSKRSLFLSFFPALLLLMSFPAAYSQTKPVVVSTSPPDMATNLSPMLASFSVTFSKAMNTQYGGLFTNGWPLAAAEWSSDKKTITSTRVTTDPLPAGFTFEIYLNLSVVEEQYKFRDTEGNFLDSYKFIFTIEGGNAGMTKVPANPAKGFSWPYYLYIPPSTKSPTVLLVQPNNTGTVNDDPAVHDSSARDMIEGSRYWADELGSPYLVPTFPRPATLPVGYTHALDRDVLLTTVSAYSRIDLQLIAMIDDARSYLHDKGIEISQKVFMAGVSASGSFTSRFTMLHPDRIKAASIGAPGFGPIVPVSLWNGQSLPYPEGIADLQTLVGSSFNAVAFKNVPLQVWVGDEDYNVDPWWNSSDPTVARIIAAFGGRHLYSRWPRYEAAYGSVTSLGQFVVFPDMGHAWAPWSYIREFFERNRSTAQPPLPKPLQYRIYFPHVASYLSWETEIALVNTIPGGASVKGELQAFNIDGEALETIPIDIAPGGRREITVGTSFQSPEAIAYLVFVSDSGFIAGYTRFNQPGNRVSLPAASGIQEGWFPKMESDGWTGLAFVNIGDEKANVRLSAYNNEGARVVEDQTLEVESGAKVIGLIDEVFPAGVSNARYFYFSSDQKVLAFSVSGSRDGLMLDGLPSLGWYIK